MTQIAYPLDNTLYSASDVRLFHVARYTGIFNVTGTDLQVSSNGGLSVKVLPGYAFMLTGTEDIGGFTYGSNGIETFTISTPGSSKRYDYISVRYDKTTNAAELKLVKGGSSRPSSPVRNNTTYEIILAIIEVPANASAITDSNIQDVRMNSTYCGVVVDGTERIPTDQFHNQFNAFMDTIKDTLSGDTAGSLLNKINANEERIGVIEENMMRYMVGTEDPTTATVPDGYFYFQLDS